MEHYSKRIKSIQEKMRQEGFDYLVLAPSANMYYFSGMRTTQDERLQLLVIPAEGTPSAVFPEMYRQKALSVLGNHYPLYTWDDQQDPQSIMKNIVAGKAAGLVAVDDTLWASHMITIMEVFPGCRFYPASRLVDALRRHKDEEEIRLMAKAGAIADRVMEEVQKAIRPGMSEKELALFVENRFKELADDISFKPIVASGPNSASPHHSPGERTFREKDMIVVDCGGMVAGYCSDITRTFCLGRADEEQKRVYRAVQAANQAAYEAVLAGCSGKEADAAARNVIAEAGYGQYFIHRTGHGIGLEVHEAPYLVQGNSEKLVTGNAFSIEPGIYLAGKFGVRIEDIVVISEKGALRLNSFNRDLVEL